MTHRSYYWPQKNYDFGHFIEPLLARPMGLNSTSACLKCQLVLSSPSVFQNRTQLLNHPAPDKKHLISKDSHIFWGHTLARHVHSVPLKKTSLRSKQTSFLFYLKKRQEYQKTPLFARKASEKMQKIEVSFLGTRAIEKQSAFWRAAFLCLLG